MADSVKVEVRGIRELARAFKQVDDDLPNELKSAFLRVAGAVANVAQGQVPRRSGRAASSIKPRASARGASIAFGGTAAPYYPWLDFGGRVGRRKSLYRPLVVGGRYVYPAIASQKSETLAAVEKAILDAARHADFEAR